MNRLANFPYKAGDYMFFGKKRERSNESQELEKPLKENKIEHHELLLQITGLEKKLSVPMKSLSEKEQIQWCEYRKNLADCYDALGHSYFEQEAYDEAAKAFSAALNLNSNKTTKWLLDINQHKSTLVINRDTHNPQEQFVLGFQYFYGLGVSVDRVKAKELYELSAKQGHADAQYHLAALYDEGRVVRRNYSTARELYQLATGQGHAGARYALGSMYLNDRGVSKDSDKALELLQLAAEQGDVDAQYMLAILCRKDNSDEYIRWLHLAAAQCNASALRSLGFVYDLGDKVPKDTTLSIEYYTRAAETGDATAQRLLGSLYVTGGMVTKNIKEAIRLYKLAANQGDGLAQTYLGDIYSQGELTQNGYTKVVRWYQLAAEQGCVSAQLSLGKMYFEGKGVERDIKEAARWCRLAGASNPQSALDLLQCLKSDTNPVVRYHVYMSQKNLDAAVKHLLTSKEAWGELFDYDFRIMSQKLCTGLLRQLEHLLKELEKIPKEELKKWQGKLLNRFNFELFLFYKQLEMISNDENYNLRRFNCLNSLDMDFMDDSDLIDRVILNLTGELLSIETDEFPEQLMQAGSKKIVSLVMLADAKGITLTAFQPVVMLLVNTMLKRNVVTNPSFNGINVSHMMMLIGLYRNFESGKEITPEIINRQLGLNLIPELESHDDKIAPNSFK